MQACERRRRRDREKSNIKAGRHPREILITVPNAPLRERYLTLLAEGLVTPAALAARLGWVSGRGPSRPARAGDGERLKRALGLSPSSYYRKRDKVRVTYFVDALDYEVAERLCLALHADPVAVGV